MSVSDVVRAVELVQSTGTEGGARMAAQEVLDAVKADVDSLNMVEELVDVEQHPMVRHFGLSVVEDVLKYKWKELGGEGQEMLKSLVLRIVAMGTREIGEEEFYIKSKVIDCVLLCMLHDWPQKWESLLEDLVEIGSRSDTQAELVLKLLYDFSVYLIRLNKLGIVVSRSNVTTLRRKQLCSSFRSAMPDLFAFLHSALVNQAEMYMGAREALEVEPSDELLAVASSKAMLVQAGIKAISQFLLWIDCKLLGTSPVLPVVAPFLADPNMAVDAVEVMSKLLFRKHLRANEPFVMELFDFVPQLFGVLSEPLYEELAPVHELNKAVVDVLVEVGMLQLRIFRRARADQKADASAPDPELHPHFFTYVESLMSLSEAHPSLKVQTSLVKFWRRFIDSGLVDKSAGLAGSDILQEVLSHALRLLALEDPFVSDDAMTVALAKLDFNNGDECSSFKRALERRAGGLVSALTRMDGHGLVAYMTQYVAHVFGAVDPDDASIGEESEAGRMLRALCLFSSTVIRALPRRCLVAPDPDAPVAYLLGRGDDDSDDELTLATLDLNGGAGWGGQSADETGAALAAAEAARVATVEALAGALGGVITYSHPSKGVIANQLRLLTSFTPFLKHYSEQLKDTFDFAFSFLTYKDGSEAGVPVSELTEASIEVRGKAAKALHSIIVFVGEKLASELQGLWEEVQALDEADELRHEEKSCVYELVIISASKSQDAELQRAVVATILEPLLGQWASAEFEARVGDPGAVLTSLGVLGNDPSVRGTLFAPEHMAFRADLYFVVSVVFVVTKWSASWRSEALLPHLETLLPLLLSLISTMHGVWEDEVQAAVPELFAPAFALPDETPSATLARATSLPSHELETGAQLRLLTYWLDSVQSRLYSSLGAIAKVRQLYEEPELGAMLSSSVFTSLPSLPNRYLVGVTMSVVSSLFRMCPYAMREAVVGPILIPWIEFMQEKLGGEWAAFYTREREGSNMSPEEEVLVDKDLGMLTTCHARLLQTVSFRLPRRPREVVEGNESPTTPPHVLESEPLRSTYLQSAMMLVQTPTLAAVSVAVNVCARLVPHVADIPDYQYVLSSELLPALIEALAHTEEESVIRNILALVMEIYCRFTSSFPEQTRGVLSAVPKVTMDTLAEFEGALEAASSSRARRQLFRELLADVIGSNVIHKMYERGGEEEDIKIEHIAPQAAEESGSTRGGL